jgi:hypothetical protein
MSEEQVQAVSEESQQPVEALEQVQDPATQGDPQKDTEWRRKMAHLAQMEKRVRNEKLTMKEQLAKLERLSKYEEMEKKLSEDPLSVLQEKGWDYNKITEKVLSQRQLTPDEKIEMIEQKLRKKEEDEIKRIEEEKQSEELIRQQQAINSFKAQINSFVEEKASEYELIVATDSHDVVFDVIQQHFNKTKKILPLEQACKMVETEIETQLMPRLEKAQKVRNKFLPQQPADSVKVPADTTAKKVESHLVTLTNKATAPIPEVEHSRVISRDESLERAARLLKWS